MRHPIAVAVLLSACTEWAGPASTIRAQTGPPQATQPPLVEDFVVGTDRLDLLLVLDDTSAMVDHQEALADFGPAVLRELLLQEFDFHLAVITGDPAHEGRLREALDQRIVHPDSPDPLEVLTTLLDVGTGGAAFAGLEAARVAVQAGEANFVREGSALHLVVLAASEDSSPASPSELDAWIDGLEAEHERVVISAAVPSDDPTWPDLVARTGGLHVPLDTDQGEWSLTALAGARPAHHFSLTRRPNPGTLSARVAGEGDTMRFEGGEVLYDERSTSVSLFDFDPVSWMRVSIRYRPRSAN